MHGVFFSGGSGGISFYPCSIVNVSWMGPANRCSDAKMPLPNHWKPFERPLEALGIAGIDSYRVGNVANSVYSVYWAKRRGEVRIVCESDNISDCSTLAI